MVLAFLGKFLAKKERQNNREIIIALAQIAPHITVTEAVAVCRENLAWSHQGLLVETSEGSIFMLHRCRNVWFMGSGSESLAVTAVEFGRGVIAHVELIQKIADGLDGYVPKQ